MLARPKVAKDHYDTVIHHCTKSKMATIDDCISETQFLQLEEKQCCNSHTSHNQSSIIIKLESQCGHKHTNMLCKEHFRHRYLYTLLQIALLFWCHNFFRLVSMLSMELTDVQAAAAFNIVCFPCVIQTFLLCALHYYTICHNMKGKHIPSSKLRNVVVPMYSHFQYENHASSQKHKVFTCYCMVAAVFLYTC